MLSRVSHTTITALWTLRHHQLPSHIPIVIRVSATRSGSKEARCPTDHYQCEGGATYTHSSHGYRSPGSHPLGPTVPLFPVEGFLAETSSLYPTLTQLAPFHAGYWPRARYEGGGNRYASRTDNNMNMSMSMNMNMNMGSRHRDLKFASFTRRRTGNAGRIDGSGWTYTVEYKESHHPSVTSPASELSTQGSVTHASYYINAANRHDREIIKKLIHMIDDARSVISAITIRCPPNPGEATPPTLRRMFNNVHINDTEGRDVDKPRTRQLHVWRLANESPMHERETRDRSEIWYRTPWGAWEEVENWMLDRSDLSSQNRVLRITAREVGQVSLRQP
jgi:hypothetical protein